MIKEKRNIRNNNIIFDFKKLQLKYPGKPKEYYYVCLANKYGIDRSTIIRILQKQVNF